MGQELAFEISLAIQIRRLGRLKRELRVLHRLLEIRIAELQDYGVGRHGRTRSKDDPLDATLGRRRNPADLLGDERTGAANLPEHRAALDGVDPDRRAIDGGRRGLQLRDPDSDEDNDHQEAGAVQGAPDFLLFDDVRRTCDVDHLLPLS